MAESHAGAPRGPAGASAIRWGRVALVAAFFFAVFYSIEHDPASFAGLQLEDTPEDRIKDTFIDSIEDGNSTRRLAITGFAAAGLAGLVLCRERPWNVRREGVAVLGALVLWIVASTLWSVDVSLTLRRIVVAAFMLVGSLGFARMLRPNELVAVAMVTFAAFVGNSLVIELGAGGRPWTADYRFAGTLHPNIQAAYCGMLALAAFACPAGFGLRWVARGLCVFGFVMLLQTQSRTSALAVIVGMLMVFLVRLRPDVRYAAAIALVGFTAVATIVVSSLGDGGQKRLTDTVLLGRTEQSSSLTGRVPLWQELSGFAAKRWIHGYGYESFWTPDNIAAVMKSQKWALQSAHNAYFEVVLQLGWVGLLLAVGSLATGSALLQTAYARTGLAGHAFGYGVTGFAAANSLLESHFAKLKYPTVTALIAVLGVVAFFPAERPAADSEAPDAGHTEARQTRRRSTPERRLERRSA